MPNRSKPRRLFRKLRGEHDLEPSPGTYVGIQSGEIVNNLTQAEVITSESARNVFIHYPVIDLDVPCYVVPTNGAHKYTLFIDHPVADSAYFDMLDAMANAGVVERGYARVSRRRRYSAARLPWVNKRESASE